MLIFIQSMAGFCPAPLPSGTKEDCGELESWSPRGLGPEGNLEINSYNLAILQMTKLRYQQTKSNDTAS